MYPPAQINHCCINPGHIEPAGKIEEWDAEKRIGIMKMPAPLPTQHSVKQIAIMHINRINPHVLKAGVWRAYSRSIQLRSAPDFDDRRGAAKHPHD